MANVHLSFWTHFGCPPSPNKTRITVKCVMAQRRYSECLRQIGHAMVIATNACKNQTRSGQQKDLPLIWFTGVVRGSHMPLKHRERASADPSSTESCHVWMPLFGRIDTFDTYLLRSWHVFWSISLGLPFHSANFACNSWEQASWFLN